jgi:transcriptional regulator with XRE-family HTH domain
MGVKHFANKAVRSMPLPFPQGDLQPLEQDKTGAFEALRQFVIAERTKRRLSQRDVAKLGGMSYGVLATLEAGKVPTIPKQGSLEKIAKGLGIPYQMLDRIARGLPPTDPATDRRVDELMLAWERLSPDHREIALRMIQALPGQ